MNLPASEAVRERIEVSSGVAPLSAASLGVRLGLLRIANAKRVALADTEAIGKGCEVALSSVCVSARSAVPLSALVDAQVVVGELPDNDLLSFELAGKRAPATFSFASKVPVLFALPALRGQSVTQQVWVKSAMRLVMPPVGEANEALAKELSAERAQAVAASASERVIEVLAGRLGFVPTQASVHARALETWTAIDKPRLSALGFDDAFLRRSQGVWVATPDILDWARRQLMAKAVLFALFEAGVLDADSAAAEAATTLRSVWLKSELLAAAGDARAEALYAQSVLIVARRHLMRLPCVLILDA